MGWAGGSRIANAVWDAIKSIIPEEHKREAAKKIVDALDEGDWDTHDEAPELMEASGYYWCGNCWKKKDDGPRETYDEDGWPLCAECALKDKV